MGDVCGGVCVCGVPFKKKIHMHSSKVKCILKIATINNTTQTKKLYISITPTKQKRKERKKGKKHFLSFLAGVPSAHVLHHTHTCGERSDLLHATVRREFLALQNTLLTQRYIASCCLFNPR